MYVLLLLFILAGAIWLQITLSKQPSKWLGLILPLICFFLSISAAFAAATFNTTRDADIVSETNVDAELITSDSTPLSSNELSLGQILGMTVPIFVVTNLPTLLFLSIYFSIRKKQSKSLELDKMKLQDLE